MPTRFAPQPARGRRKVAALFALTHGSAQINLGKVTNTKISTLINLPQPSDLPDSSRIKAGAAHANCSRSIALHRATARGRPAGALSCPLTLYAAQPTEVTQFRITCTLVKYKLVGRCARGEFEPRPALTRCLPSVACRSRTRTTTSSSRTATATP